MYLYLYLVVTYVGKKKGEDEDEVAFFSKLLFLWDPGLSFLSTSSYKD